MKGLRFLIVAIVSTFAATASAVPFLLVDGIRCGGGNATNGIAVSDVTGNEGGASECWGTFDGNGPGPSGDGFQIGTMTYDYLAKDDGTLDDLTPIGLDVDFLGTTSGSWAFTNGALGGDFIIVLKAASTPGFAVWLFEDVPSNTSTSGDWNIAWTNGGGSTPDLSYLSIYLKTGSGPYVPEPATIVLFGIGLLGLRSLRRRA